MARRDLLHINQLEAFEDWAVARGWESVATFGAFEVLRLVQTHCRPVILYQKMEASEHVTVPEGEAMLLVRRWFRERRAAS